MNRNWKMATILERVRNRCKNTLLLVSVVLVQQFSFLLKLKKNQIHIHNWIHNFEFMVRDSWSFSYFFPHTTGSIIWKNGCRTSSSRILLSQIDRGTKVYCVCECTRKSKNVHSKNGDDFRRIEFLKEMMERRRWDFLKR